MITLPGLIDPHVHFRTPGQTHKEDFYTGTSAALGGGYTTVFDMPNNLMPITTYERLKEKQHIAKEQTVCDIGFHFGSLGDNLDEFTKVQGGVVGIKIFLNQTTGGFVVTPEIFAKICDAWPRNLPMMLHAEENILQQVLQIGKQAGQRLHVCHVSSASELQKIINAKESYDKITCGVCPHHLFLTEDATKKLGAFANMKPSLKTQEDIDFLWKHLADIDLIESDHAPHSREEKESNTPPFGVTGLETTLSLLLTATHAGKLTIEDIKRLCHDNAAKIFNIDPNFVTPSDQRKPGNLSQHTTIPVPSKGILSNTDAINPSTSIKTTRIEVDENEEWIVDQDKLFTKAKMSPFNGWKLHGKVKQVFIRGTKVFEDGKILVKPGFGKIVKAIDY